MDSERLISVMSLDELAETWDMNPSTFETAIRNSKEVKRAAENCYRERTKEAAKNLLHAVIRYERGEVVH